MSNPDRIVIIGGGHAGAQLCNALASAGLASCVDLVCEESEFPYHRPPLSKGFLKAATEKLQPLRPAGWYLDAGIKVHQADPARRIDRLARCVYLNSGASLPYKFLVIATGSRSRVLPGLSEDLANVMTLRSGLDAERLRDLLQTCQKLTVLGGGFIGLEVAASARAMGKAVQILESAPRLLARSVSKEISSEVLEVHQGQGTDMRLGVSVDQFVVTGGRLQSLAVNAVPQEVELLVLGIGAIPETGLADAAGLICENGIVVDAHLRTSDPSILAIGDCASFVEPSSGRRMRLESVQNANDQARTAASTITGQPQAHAAVPWFWSDQASLRLQIVGLLPANGKAYRRPGAGAHSFSMLHYVDDQLVCVESVNAPLDHLPSRKLIEAGCRLAPEVACDPATPLKQYLQQ